MSIGTQLIAIRQTNATEGQSYFFHDFQTKLWEVVISDIFFLWSWRQQKEGHIINFVLQSILSDEIFSHKSLG